MYIMFVLIGFSLIVALTFLGLYLWAVRSGQFDDKYTPSVRMLFDDGTTTARSGSADDDAPGSDDAPGNDDAPGGDDAPGNDEDSEERTNTGDRSNGS